MIPSLPPSTATPASRSRPLTETQSSANARETINRLPVSSTINSLSRVLGGISLTLGAARNGSAPEAGADVPPGPAADSQAREALRRYAEIDAIAIAIARASGDKPDGRAE